VKRRNEYGNDVEERGPSHSPFHPGATQCGAQSSIKMRFAGCRNTIRALPGGHGKSFPQRWAGVCSVCALREDGERGRGLCTTCAQQHRRVGRRRAASACLTPYLLFDLQVKRGSVIGQWLSGGGRAARVRRGAARAAASAGESSGKKRR
jgi:hypothetical protein